MVLATTAFVVFSVIQLFPSARKERQLIEIMRSVQDLTRPQAGCLGCWLSEQDAMHNNIRYLEQWESEEALTHHIASELYRRILAAMELSSKQPEVRFYLTNEVKGFELIEQIRTSTHTRQSTARA